MKRKPLRPKKAGSAIALVLIAVVMLLLMGGGLLSLGLHGRTFAARTASEIAARSAADAGLTKALFEMNEKLKVYPWNDSNLPQVTNATLANCDATFNYTVTGDITNGYAIECIGNSSLAEGKVNATLRLQALFEGAIYTLNGIVLENNTLVDAYDSNDGLYGSGNSLESTSIATASEEPGAIENNATLYGDSVAGYERDLPEILPPTGGLFDISNGAITPSGTLTLYAADSGRYDSITLESGKTLSIVGDVTLYVTGDILIGQSYVDIPSGSSLTIYIGGNFTARNTTLINTITKEPKRCQMYAVGSGQTFMLEQSTTFYGSIYAPNSTVHLDNSAELYGAIVANDFELSNSAGLHYDNALGEAASIGDWGTTFVVDRWQEE